MNQHKSLSTIINKLQRKELLLHMEYNYEKETFKQQTEAMGIDRKVKRGMCWYPVSTGRSYYNSLNQLVIEMERQEDKEIEHVFEFGRPVCFFTQDAPVYQFLTNPVYSHIALSAYHHLVFPV